MDDETNVKTEGDEVVIEKSGCITLSEIQEAINAAVEMFGGNAKVITPGFDGVYDEAWTMVLAKKSVEVAMSNSTEYNESKNGEDRVCFSMYE